ncbi:beta-lactamase family protein [Clostridium estertheticum]|uniref:serine hydrolase domain-containing protein n=1 Tax=Clostridium estertheticum TaxID=238834 RepID=UPI001C0CCA10|nr:serine hydrolase domain-containing protein [Clostridium estertheticum]MBU3174849.1 beta-lactamase family protein [Clostridium estertheticum]
MTKKNIIKIISLLFTFIIITTGCGRSTPSTPNTSKTINSVKTGTRTKINNIKKIDNSMKIDNSEIQSKISKYIDSYSPNDKFNGTILVAKDDKVLSDKGYGMADSNKKIVNKPKTAFEIASLTKQFTATAILMLQEKKLLNVQDTVDKYIPDYPDGDKIKIYDLLTHTAGIPDYNQSSIPPINGKHTYTLNESVKLFKNKPRHFESGAKYEYSSSNYILLGYIIEKVSGINYEEYIDKNIFKPLKLIDTGFLTYKAIIKGKANGYYRPKKTDNYTTSFDKEGSILPSAGGIYSTVDDLYTWYNALFDGKLINKESLNGMITPHLHSYGYGLIITKKANGNIMIWDNGSTLGYTSYLGKDINKKYVIIILSNKYAYNVMPIVSGLSNILEMKK